MAPNPEATQRRLIGAAETLFAERGIDAVSLREINAASGMGNATALQYHFRDRDGLLRAVLAKHHTSIEVQRHRLLDECVHSATGDVRALAGALVRPEADKLADADGGRAYLRINAQLFNRTGKMPESRSAKRSINRWRAMVAPLLSEDAVQRLHHRYAAIRFSATELGRRAAEPARRDDRLFVANLVDLVAALLSAPVSAETEALLRQRD